MVKITIDYEGDLHCAATHVPSATRLATDATVDNEGRGESFSPTDLVATALGSCMATTMAIVARRKGVELAGTKVEVDKEMTAQPGRVIAAGAVEGLTNGIHVWLRGDRGGPAM